MYGTTCVTVLGLLLPLGAAGVDTPKPLTQEEMVAKLTKIDAEMYSPADDYSALVLLEQKQKDEPDRVFQLVVLRRDSDRALIMQFTKPKTEAGNVWMRIGDNLWYYNPRIGKWERRTSQDRIGGTDALTRDFDRWTMSADYDPVYDGSEKLGDFMAHKLKLTAKPNKEVVFPRIDMWIDVASGHPLKLQFMALSGRLMQSVYYPHWVKQDARKAGSFIFYPKEIRVFDEVTQKSETTIMIQQVELKRLPDNNFTKAWVETQSR
jgi:outer membrane lipoprotein-sorting protein